MHIDAYLYGYVCMHIVHRDHLFVRIQIIYDMLDVKLEERGESFYNPFLSQVVADLTSAELLEESEGAQVFVVCNKKDDKKLPVDRLRYRYLRRARVPSSVLCIPVSMSLNAHTHAHTHTHTHTHTQMLRWCMWTGSRTRTERGCRCSCRRATAVSCTPPQTLPPSVSASTPRCVCFCERE